MVLSPLFTKIFGARGAIRTHTVLVLSETTLPNWSTRASNWWVPGDLNPDSPRGNTALQAGAASRIRLAPKNHRTAHYAVGARSQTSQRACEPNPVTAFLDACRLSSAVASRPPR